MRPAKRKNRKQLSQRALTAFHEAGHAVVAYALRRHFRKLSIAPDATSLGRANLWPLRYRSVELDRSRRNRDRLEKEIMTLYGGLVAEQIVQGGYDVRASAKDLQRAAELAMLLTDTDEEAWALLRLLHIRTRQLLQQPVWSTALQQLSKQLRRRCEMSYDECRVAIEDAISGTAGARTAG
jgi:ATP-dependent Zn protease